MQASVKLSLSACTKLSECLDITVKNVSQYVLCLVGLQRYLLSHDHKCHLILHTAQRSHEARTAHKRHDCIQGHCNAEHQADGWDHTRMPALSRGR